MRRLKKFAMNLNELFETWKNKGENPDERLFAYIIQGSYEFEDLIDDICEQAYKKNLRSTEIKQDMCNDLYNELDYGEIIKFINNREKIDFNSENELKDYIKQKDFFRFIYEYIQDWYRFIISEKNQNEDVDIEECNELNTIKDEIGDEHNVGKKFTIDVPVRDYCFVIYNGKWYMGDELNCNSHTEIINHIFGDNSAKSINLRDIENVENADPNAPIIFGDGIGNLGFIESYQNISESEAVNIVKKKFKKVYQYHQTENKVKRLAKKV